MGGEKQGDREVKENLVKDLRGVGASPRVAEEKARKAMLEADRRLRALGRR